MKPTEQKREFVKLRGEGRSFDFIADRLKISKSTCLKWQKSLSSEIDEQRRAELDELRKMYGMTREARIRRLGDTLNRICSEIDKTDFSRIEPGRLLDFKLKYLDALKKESVGTNSGQLDAVDAAGILSAFADLLDRMRTGDVTTEQAREEAGILAQLLKAYETTEIKAKLDELETLVLEEKEGLK